MESTGLVSRIARAANDCFDEDPADFTLAVQKNLKTLLEHLQLEDVGLSRDKISPKQVRPGKTYSMNIYESSRFCLAVFILGPGAKIPLHDHPDITVMTKVLHGSVQITSLDWVERPESHAFPPSWQHQAVVKSNIQMNPASSPTLIHESYWNIHEIYAPEITVLFDVQLPPYSDDDEKDCHYFRVGMFTEAGSKSSISTAPFNHHHRNGSKGSAKTTTTTTTKDHDHDHDSDQGHLDHPHLPKITFNLPKPTSPLVAPLAFLKPQMRVVLQKYDPDLPGEAWEYTGPEVDDSSF